MSTEDRAFSAFAKALARDSEELLDPGIWQPALEKYSEAVHLAVALVDREGRCGTITNPLPTWSHLRSKTPPLADECAFAVLPVQTCTCVAEAWRTRSLVIVQDRARLMHFAVPLLLGEQRVGALLAGQVFDQYPDQLVLEHVAQQMKVSWDDVWQIARLEQPVKRKTLQVYADLLWLIGDTLLQTRYQKLVEARRLAEIDKLRVDLQDRVKDLELFEASVVGREIRMIELEKEMESLKRQAGWKQR
jgi:ligand-binding sensor protein